MKTKTASASSCSFVAAAALLVLCFAVEASAKRGCSAFGHSCFGGHGKRSFSDGVDDDRQAASVSIRHEIQDYDTPRSGGEVPLADPGQIFQDRPTSRFQTLLLPPRQNLRYNMTPFIREWLASYRRANGADLEPK